MYWKHSERFYVFLVPAALYSTHKGKFLHLIFYYLGQVRLGFLTWYCLPFCVSFMAVANNFCQLQGPAHFDYSRSATFVSKYRRFDLMFGKKYLRGKLFPHSRSALPLNHPALIWTPQSETFVDEGKCWARYKEFRENLTTKPNLPWPSKALLYYVFSWC